MPVNYQQFLDAANQGYSQTLAGYQTAMNAQIAAQNQVAAGYNTLYQNVLGGIQGVEKSASQQIADVYSKQVGAATQGLVSAGLGNTTVTSGVMRGLTLDEQKAQVALQNQFAQLQAGYQSQLGLAGLGYQGQAVQANTALAQQKLGAMNAYAQQQGQLGLGAMGLENQYEIARLNAQARVAGSGGYGGSSNPFGFGHQFAGGGGGGGAPYGMAAGYGGGGPQSNFTMGYNTGPNILAYGGGGGGYGGSEMGPMPSPYIEGLPEAGDWSYG